MTLRWSAPLGGFVQRWSGGAGRVLVVSDPLHLRRAVTMARDLGIDAWPAATPTSRYQTLGTQLPMLAREVWFTLVYRITGQ